MARSQHPARPLPRSRHRRPHHATWGRLLVALVAGFATFMLPWFPSAPTRWLAAWDTGTLVFVAMAWWTIERFDAAETRAQSEAMNVRGLVLSLAILLAAVASLYAIASLASGARDAAAGDRSLHVGLSLGALALSWVLIHTLFTFRYARRYFGGPTGDDPQGLSFPGNAQPDYRDFAYFSFVIGMTSQVSDVQVTSHHMRRLALVHGVLSFFFNLVALALCVNIVAGMF